VRVKHCLLSGLAPLLVLACAQSANAEVIYKTVAGEETTLSLTKSDKLWTLTVSNQWGKWQQVNLLPLHHPLDKRPPHHLKIEQEANSPTSTAEPAKRAQAVLEKRNFIERNG